MVGLGVYVVHPEEVEHESVKALEKVAHAGVGVEHEVVTGHPAVSR